MTVADITNDVKDVSAKVDPIGHTFKFVFEDGVVFVDGTGSTTVVDNEDRDAECELHMKLATYEKLKSGKMNPTMALMMGKVKVKGDMGIALKLQNYI